MTVKVTKPAVNLREKLAEVDKPSGIAGEAMLRAETPQEQFNLIGAGRKNLIINGAMQVAQRATSAGPTVSSGYLCVDRFPSQAILPGTGTVNFTYEQSTDAPDGFGISYKVNIDATSYTPISYDFASPFGYSVEGKDADCLGWGSSDAKPMVLSFWYKSTLTGVHSLFIRVPPSSDYNSSTEDSNFHQGFEVTQANVWKRYTIIIPAITSNQQWVANSSETAFTIGWNPVSYQSYAKTDFNGGDYEGKWIEKNNWGGIVPGHDHTQGWGESHDFYLTGVQLELGRVATPFEHRSYGEELALCQRYYEVGAFHIQGYPGASSYVHANVHFKVEKRATPTITVLSGGNNSNFSTGPSPYDISAYGLRMEVLSTNAGRVLAINRTYTAEAEL